ncbi:MAG: hypothetical protein J7J65_03635 [Candidatus Korarchaeota archaeon]|nr:hypothetical protein [Candidatus Korarchaeota archaeon]
MNGSCIARIALASLLLVLLLPLIIPETRADILSEKPHYVSTDVMIFFKTEDTAEVRINFTWYGLWANDLERALNKTGEENYTREFINYVKRVVQGPFIGGDMEFYPKKMDARIEKRLYYNTTRRIDLVFTAELEAVKGAPTVSAGRKGIVYSTREDVSNLSKLYVKGLDLLNLTVILPKNYVVSISRPRPSSIYLANVSGDLRVVVSWMLKSPTVDTREASGYSGWFFLGIVNHTKEEVEALKQIRRKVSEIRKAGSLNIDESTVQKVQELFELYYKLSTLAPKRVDKNITYALKLANEISIYPASPELIVAGSSIGIMILELVAYLLYRRRSG